MKTKAPDDVISSGWEPMAEGFVNHRTGYAFTHGSLEELGCDGQPLRAIEEPHVRELARLWYERRFGSFEE